MVTRKFKWLTIFLLISAFVLLGVKQVDAYDTLIPLVRGTDTIYYYNTSTQVMTPDPQEFVEKEYEMRATWVATVSNLNMPIATSEAQYKAAFIDMIDRVKAAKLNTIFFQTRPMNDAFYESDYAPWSKYLTGTEDVSLTWDAMAWMIDYAHSQGIEFHAWLNPYRVTTGTAAKATQLASLSDGNWAKQNPDMVIAGNDAKLILNPGEPSVRNYLLNVVDELITNYDVDGIHFDDYFYPYSGIPNSEDALTYSTYNPNGLSLADWRRHNVDLMVESVFNLIEMENTTNQRNLKFGISPFGIWDNLNSNPLGSNTNGSSSYSAQYADTRKWVKEGWLHYITPQLYWHFDHSLAPFADLIDWWADVVDGTEVALIPGLGIYRAGNTSTYPGYYYDETAAQINYMSKYSDLIKGAAMYSVDYVSGQAMAYVNNDYWTTTPLATWEPQAEAPEADAPLIALQRGTSNIYYRGTTTPVMTPDPSYYVEDEYEMRATWVPTVWRLWAPQLSSTPTEAQYKDAFMNLITNLKSKNFNTIFFQVRGFNDAWYDSMYAPYSRYLFGSEGADPGWDVMNWMIDYTHAQGMEFHAWLNPYRVTTGTAAKDTQLAALDDANWAKLNPTKVIADNNGALILNPGEPAVRTYLLNVIDELITNYDVDGIHFDDYFYSYAGTPSSEDLAAYQAYNPNQLTLADWRRENIDLLVESVYNLIENENQTQSKDLKFGMSPFGVWDNISSNPLGSNTQASSSYHSQFADSRKWVKEGWLHYITPQLYFDFRHTFAPYADILTWWVDVVRGTDVDLIPGLDISKADASWLPDEIAAEVNFNSQFPEIKGAVLYSSAYINGQSVSNLTSNLWQTQPLGTFETYLLEPASQSIEGTKVGDVYRSDVTVTLTSTEDTYYKIGTDGTWTYYSEPITVIPNGKHVIYYQTIAANGDHSEIASVNFTISKINSVLPVITVSGETSGTSYVVGATVTLSASDHTIWVAINHGNIGLWEPYTEPIVLDDLSSNGVYYIQTKTIDSEGTESAVVTKSVKVVAALFDDPEIIIEGEGNDPYYQSATVSFSHVAPELSYRINDGEWLTYSEPILFDTEGVYEITYKNVEDNAVVFSKTITIDQTAPDMPVIDIDGEYDGERFYLSEVDISFLTDDDATIRYRYLNEDNQFTTWFTYTNAITFSKNGTNRIVFEATDEAGNVSERGDVFFYLDIPPIEDNLYVIRDGNTVYYRGTTTPVELPTSYTEKDEEIRAVWVATVSNIDIAQHTSETQYKTLILTMLDQLVENNINTMFFQVRPMNDAFYDSAYAPWSRYLTGIEGQDPGWDVLSFIIEEAHNRGIEFHAWLNPYRVSSGTSPKAEQLALLSEDNFAKQHPEWVLSDTEGHLILNPGVPAVRTYIYNIIDELMNDYDVDGIHFDDYFYSYSGTSYTEDNAEFLLYNPNDLSQSDWRRENINILIESIFNQIEDYNQQHQLHVKFGISPIGIWRNKTTDPLGSNTAGFQSYDSQFADTRKWVKEGWLHYIMPQVYWEFSRTAAPFADVVDWWAETVDGTGVDLIIGHGLYNYVDQTWDDENEMTEQLRYTSKYDQIIGHAIFSYKTLINPMPIISQTMDRLNDYYWTSPVGFSWQTDVKYALIKGIDDITITRGTSFDSLNGVSVYDLIHGDITSELSVNGMVDINQVGTYPMVYTVTGSDGLTVTRTRYVHVVSETASLSGLNDVSAAVHESFNPLTGISATDTLLGDITANITYTGTYNASVAGTYELTYAITGSDNVVVTGTRTITIYAASIIISGDDLSIGMGSSFYPLYEMTASDEGVDVLDQITVTGEVNTLFIGDYELTYTYDNGSDNPVSFSRTISVVTTTADIDYNGNRTITIKQHDDFDILEGVTASDSINGDITSEITTYGEVDTETVGTYVIVYRVEDASGVTFMTYRTIHVEAVEAPVETGCLTGCSSEIQFVQASVVIGLVMLGLTFMGIVLLKKKY